MKNKELTEAKQDIEILDNIPFKPDTSEIAERLRFHKFSDQFGNIEQKVQDLVKLIAPIVRPKALFKICRVEHINPDSLKIEGVPFNSSLLRVNLEKVNTVFVYAITSGEGIDAPPIPVDNADYQYLLNVIREQILSTAREYLRQYLLQHYHLKYIWSLSPGEFQSWPVEQRRPLFSILGDAGKKGGVRLLEDNSLQPAGSQLGIIYYAEMDFENCQSCPNKSCMMRRAPYDPEIARQTSNQRKNSCASQ